MRVRLGLAVLAHVPMHIEVGHHAAFDELLFDELAGELDALLLVQLARNRELDFAGKLRVLALLAGLHLVPRSEEHTSELQSLMRISYAVFCLKKKKHTNQNNSTRSSRY